MATFLIDTNVLVYAHDAADAVRSTRAQDVLMHLGETGAGRLSVQVLAEFVSIATRKLDPPLTPAEAQTQIELLAQSFPVFDLTVPIILEAVRGLRAHQFAYYDAQVWATARLNQIPVVLTEDIPSAEMIEGVRFVNPFADKFSIEEWL